MSLIIPYLITCTIVLCQDSARRPLFITADFLPCSNIPMAESQADSIYLPLTGWLSRSKL